MTQPNYRYPDNYVASFKHLRDLDTSLKSYVDSAVSQGGGGSGNLRDEIETTDSSTSVKVTLTGVEIKDDATLIATISKDAATTKIKGELDGLIVATNDLTISTKDGASTIVTFNNSQIQTTTSILQNATQGNSDGHLTRKDYVDGAIATAKNNVTQLVDADQTDGSKYKLQIANN